MLFKYPVALKGEFKKVENYFNGILAGFDFVETVDYDGGFLTIIVKPEFKDEAEDKEGALNDAIFTAIQEMAA